MSDYQDWSIGYSTTKAGAVNDIKRYIEKTFKKYNMKVIRITQGKIYPLDNPKCDSNFYYTGLVEYFDPDMGRRVRMKTEGYGYYDSKGRDYTGVKGLLIGKPYVPKKKKRY